MCIRDSSLRLRSIPLSFSTLRWNANKRSKRMRITCLLLHQIWCELVVVAHLDRLRCFKKMRSCFKGIRYFLKEICIWLPEVKDWTTLSGRGARRCSATSVGNADFTKEKVSDVKYWIPNAVGTKYMRSGNEWIAYYRPYGSIMLFILPRSAYSSFVQRLVFSNESYQLSDVGSKIRHLKHSARGLHVIQIWIYWLNVFSVSMFLAMLLAVSRA